MQNGEPSASSIPTKPKRAFGRSLADFRIPGAETEHGLHPAEEKLLAAVASGTPCDLDPDGRKERLTEAEQRLVEDDFYAFCVEVMRTHPSPPDALVAKFDAELETVKPFFAELLRFSRGHLDKGMTWKKALDDDVLALRPVFDRTLTHFSWELAGWRIVKAGNDARVRGGFIRFLALGGDDGTPVHEKGILLAGAFIEDAIDLESAEGVRPLMLIGCQMTSKVTLCNARLDRINLSGSFVPRLIADSAEVNENVFLRDGFRALGEVRFVDAKISSSLDCRCGTFLGRTPGYEGLALDCDGAKVTGNVNLNGGFRAEGSVRLFGIAVGGDLSCNGGTFLNRTEDGQGMALGCERIRVTGNANLESGFRARGAVRFLGAAIGGDLSCRGGTFLNRTEDGQGVALACDGVTVNGSVNLSDDFHAEGAVRLLGAKIDRNLSCSDGTFLNRTADGQGLALACDRAEISGNVFLNQIKFRAEGRVSLLGVEIGGQLGCGRGQFFNHTQDGSGAALTFGGAKVTGDVFLNEDFRAEGAVYLLGAQIGGQLNCDRGRFVNWGNDGPVVALRAQKAVVAGELILQGTSIHGILDLNSAHCSIFVDGDEDYGKSAQPPGGGPQGLCRMVLDGFTYDAFVGHDAFDSKARTRWLDRQIPEHLGIEFRPQPWEQLVKVYRAMGHEDWARDVAKTKQHRLRMAMARRYFNGLSKTSLAHIVTRVLAFPFFLGEWFLIGGIAGYGYAKKRLWLLLLALLFGCAWIYTQAEEQGLFVPKAPAIVSKDTVTNACRDNWTMCPPPTMPREYLHFSPHLYSADLMLPFVSFGQEDAWEPLALEPYKIRYVKGPDLTLRIGALEWLTPWWFLRFVIWAEIVLGWGLSFFFAAVLSGIIKKD